MPAPNKLQHSRLYGYSTHGVGRGNREKSSKKGSLGATSMLENDGRVPLTTWLPMDCPSSTKTHIYAITRLFTMVRPYMPTRTEVIMICKFWACALDIVWKSKSFPRVGTTGILHRTVLGHHGPLFCLPKFVDQIPGTLPGPQFFGIFMHRTTFTHIR